MTAGENPSTATRYTIPAAAQLLWAAGLIPFIILSALIWFAIDDVTLSLILRFEMVYSALVISLLSGVRWGLAINQAGRKGYITLAASLGLMMLAWLALVPAVSAGIALLISGFVIMGLWNYLSAETGRLEPWFARLNYLLSLTAIMCLLAVLVQLHLRHL